MKQNDEKKDAKVLSQEELENVMGGWNEKPNPPFKDKYGSSIDIK